MTRTENKTRIIKLTSLDGEYILLGRQTVDTANVFVQYGFGATRTVNLSSGAGVQQAEFVDGLRLSVETEKEMRVNANLQFGIETKVLPTGSQSLCRFLPRPNLVLLEVDHCNQMPSRGPLTAPCQISS